jgi:glycosyltransferase involved in cell wall biosynthesis
MKIGFFSDSYFPEIDGVTYTLKTWKEELQDRGHKVHIIYPGSEKYQPNENEIPVHSVPNPFYNGYNIPLPTFKDFPEFDIVHCHSPGTIGIQGLIHAKRNNTPAVYTHHTPLEEYFEQHLYSSTLAKLLEKIFVPTESFYLRKFNKVTSNTGEINRNVEAEPIPVGVNTEFFQPTKNTYNYGKPTIGYSGRISMEKNVSQICKLAQKMPEHNFIIVGEGPKRKKVEQKAPENVEVKDFIEREKLPKFYTSIDVFLTASTGDTLGLSTLEANACGTPVVAPDVHPFNRTIQEQNGLRYEKGNIDKTKQKVKEALKKDWKTRKAVEKYSLNQNMDRMLQIYKTIG